MENKTIPVYTPGETYSSGSTIRIGNKLYIVGKDVQNAPSEPNLEDFEDVKSSGGGSVDIVQTIGQSTSSVMSQKACTDIFSQISKLPAKIQSNLSSSQPLFTSTDIQITHSELEKLLDGSYSSSEKTLVIPSANPTYAGAYPAEHYVKVQGLPPNSELADVLEGKVDKIEGYGLSEASFTQEEKNKLAELDVMFAGKFTSKEALDTKVGWDGAYARLDLGPDQNVVEYIWDSDTSKWVEALGVSTAETAASVKSKYESNPDTNAFTNLDKTNLQTAYSHTSNVNNPHQTSASQVGLGNVDNTSDSNKPVSLLQQAAITEAETVDFMLRFDKTGLNTNISDGNSLNILSLLTISDVSLALNKPSSEWNLSSGILKFPLPKNLSYVDYRVRIRLTGTITGSSNTGREFGLELRRQDNTLIERVNVIKTNGTQISNRGQNFETYTNSINDPFIVNGAIFVLNNDSGQNINLTGITIIIKGITK